METPSRPLRFSERIARRLPAPHAGRAGIWLQSDDGLVTVETFDVGPATVLVPSEQVLVLAVDLPLPTRRRRIEALPFAIEDTVAEPIDTVHVALGAEIGPRRYLAGVVAHDLMRAWSAQVEAAGLGNAALVPDALTLAVPPSGFWSVDLVGARALVRQDDGTGFAVPTDRLVAAWQAGGSPSCLSHGEALPPEMTLAVGEGAPEPLARRLMSPPLDLRQGPYARPRRAMPALWRRLAIAAGAGMLAHGAIAAADTLALRDVATKREAETRALVAQAAPNLAAEADLVTAASDLLPTGSGAPGRLFPLLARASSALAPLGPQVSVRNLAWVEAEGALSLDLDAPDLATLQRVEAALDAAGLDPQAGAAAAGENSAQGKVTVRDRAP